MEPEAVYSLSTEISKAITDGFTVAFVFIDGFLHVENEIERGYPIKDVCKDPRPSVESNIIVYRITAPDGCKGYAISDWEEDP